MFGLIRKKHYDERVTELVQYNKELLDENNKLKRLMDIVNEDNQELRNANDFYLRKYNDTKNMVRELTNKDPDKTVIPRRCRECGDELNYNENLHIAVCIACDITYR